jgi:histidinol-phosphate aminotransferase
MGSPAISNFKPVKMVRPHILDMPPYEPILPYEVLSETLGIPVEKLVKLDANENPYGPLPDVLDALGQLPYAHIYPDPESRQLRQALATYLRFPVENILASAGADELIDLIMRLCLAQGQSILNCPPTFGMYAFDADVNQARLINVPRLADFSLDLPGIEAAVLEHSPSLLFLASPNNPNGSLIPPEEIQQLLELPMIIVLDEAYIEFARPGSSFLHKVLEHENLVVLRTFSKWAGLAGLRVGYGAFPGWMMPHLWKIKQPYNVSVAASTAAKVSLENAARLVKTGQQIVAERERLFTKLTEIPWLVPYPSQANFILCRVVEKDARSLKIQLAQQGILLRHFNKPGLQDTIRISVGTPAQNDLLLQALNELSLQSTSAH